MRAIFVGGVAGRFLNGVGGAGIAKNYDPTVGLDDCQPGNTFGALWE